MAKQRLRVWQRFELSDADGVIAKGGELSDQKPKVIEVDGLVHNQTYKDIADAAVQKVWDAAEDTPTFKFMSFEALRGDVEVELVYGTGGTRVVSTEKVREGHQKQISFQDGRDNTHTEDWVVVGVANLLSKVTVKNTSGNLASFRIFAVD